MPSDFYLDLFKSHVLNKVLYKELSPIPKSYFSRDYHNYFFSPWDNYKNSKNKYKGHNVYAHTERW